MRNHFKFKPSEIQIWINQYTDSDQLSDQIISLLSTAEIQRANAFHFNEDRSRYIQAHALLRIILYACTGIQPQDIDYKIAVHGKPFLAYENPVHFNLSHTKEMIAVAVSPEHDIGIDVEKKADMADIDSVAHQFMNEKEYSEMGCLDAEAKKDYFYRCWVRKEALVKASGRGIDDHLRTFSVMDGFHPDGAKTISTYLEETPNTWWLKTFELMPDHLGAVCVKSSDAKAYSIKIKHGDVFECYLNNQFRLQKSKTLCYNHEPGQEIANKKINLSVVSQPE